MQDYVKINPADNVAVALNELKAGLTFKIDGNDVTLKDDIRMGHKFALTDIPEGGKVIKYGFPIGSAVTGIEAGAHIHTHNLKTLLSDNLEYKYEPAEKYSQPDLALREGEKYFEGYMRPDGRAGVRNELWIIPTVGCVNNIARRIEEQAKPLIGGSIDNVVAFNHPYGCSQMGDDQENTREALAALITHPNAGGVLVLGLGCENSNIEVLKEGYLKGRDLSRVRFLKCQDSDDEVSEGLDIMRSLAEEAGKYKREPVPLSKLIVGLKCGGSDGLSGITANPVVGRFSDILASAGGSTILTEVPEMFGAETILMSRAENEEIFGKTVRLINDFKDYFRSHNQTIYENPSPGNKEGGISTLEDKALGCTQKSGLSPVKDVLGYGEALKVPGLNLLSAPGNDLVASTALVLSGAQIVLFTTGRGTPFASAVPTVKISSNSALAGKKHNWIDFDAGRLTSGKTLDELGMELFSYVRGVAAGKPVKSEKGFRDFAIFKKGVTL